MANTYSNVQVKLPLDPGFHLKCYYFSPLLKSSKSTSSEFCYIGSANLTDTGLTSESELLVKVSDVDTVNEVSDYINVIVKESTDWNLEIERYTNDYEKQKVKPINYQPFIPKRRNEYTTIKRKRALISNAARTVDIIEKADDDEEKFAKESFDLLSKKYPNLNKNNWVIFRGLSKKEIQQRQSEYKIGSYFDREDSYNGSGWEIGAKRKICVVGAFYIDEDKGLCILFRVNRKVIPYTVTDKVIKKAEELGIKGKDDQDLLPAQKDMNKYIEFINTIRKRDKEYGCLRTI